LAPAVAVKSVEDKPVEGVEANAAPGVCNRVDSAEAVSKAALVAEACSAALIVPGDVSDVAAKSAGSVVADDVVEAAEAPSFPSELMSSGPGVPERGVTKLPGSVVADDAVETAEAPAFRSEPTSSRPGVPERGVDMALAFQAVPSLVRVTGPAGVSAVS
jgi:hypothetical protein